MSGWKNEWFREDWWCSKPHEKTISNCGQTTVSSRSERYQQVKKATLPIFVGQTIDFPLLSVFARNFRHIIQRRHGWDLPSSPSIDRIQNGSTWFRNLIYYFSFVCRSQCQHATEIDVEKKRVAFLVTLFQFVLLIRRNAHESTLQFAHFHLFSTRV